MNRKVCFVFVAVLFLVLVGGACGKRPSPTVEKPAAPESKEPYRIGAILSITGPLGALGTPQRNAAQLAVEVINQQGGINGRKVDLLVIDDESDDTKVPSAMLKLVTEQKAMAVFGPTAAGPYPIMEMARQYQVPLLVPQPENDITEVGNPWVFRVMVRDSRYISKAIDYLKKQGWDRFALLHDSTDYGNAAAEEFKVQARQVGLTISAIEKYEPTDQDMTVQLTKIKKTDPKAIVVWGTVPGPAIIARNAKALGLSQPFLGGSGINNPKFIELAGDAANGWLYTGVGFSVADQMADREYREVVQDFSQRYQRKYGSDPGSFGALGWDGMQIIFEGLRRAGEGKGDALRDAIEQIDGLKGVFGTYRYSKSDHDGLGVESVYIIKIEDGKRILVEQPSLK